MEELLGKALRCMDRYKVHCVIIERQLMVGELGHEIHENFTHQTLKTKELQENKIEFI